MKTLLLSFLISTANALAAGGPAQPPLEACQNLEGLFPVMVYADEPQPDAVLVKLLFARCGQGKGTLEKISFDLPHGQAASAICRVKAE